MSHPTNLQTEIRLQLMRASHRLRAAAQELDDAIEHAAEGGPWSEPATQAKIEIDVASDHIVTARGMALVGAFASDPFAEARR
jgi:hypothetical protein